MNKMAAEGINFLMTRCLEKAGFEHAHPRCIPDGSPPGEKRHGCRGYAP